MSPKDTKDLKTVMLALLVCHLLVMLAWYQNRIKKYEEKITINEKNQSSFNFIQVRANELESTNELMHIEPTRRNITLTLLVTATQLTITLGFLFSFFKNKVQCGDQNDSILIGMLSLPLFSFSLLFALDDFDDLIISHLHSKFFQTNFVTNRKYVCVQPVFFVYNIIHVTMLTITYIISCTTSFIMLSFASDFVDCLLNLVAILFVNQFDSLVVKYLDFEVGCFINLEHTEQSREQRKREVVKVFVKIFGLVGLVSIFFRFMSLHRILPFCSLDRWNEDP